MSLKILLKCVVKDQTGQIVSVYGHKRSQSFLRNFIMALFAQMREINLTGALVNLAGVVRGIDRWSGNFGTPATEGMTTRHICVGRGTKAVEFADYKLESPIPHGTGSGQLIYRAGEYIAPSIEGSKMFFALTRAFENLTTASIDVTEVGVIASFYATGVGVESFLIIRDLITTRTIPPNHTLIVSYVIEIIL